MFTGIIEEIGSIKSIVQRGPGKTFEIKAHKILEDLKIDQSVAINGVCLTAVKIEEDSFFADAVGETLDKTTLQQVKKGDPVILNEHYACRIGSAVISFRDMWTALQLYTA